jgi:hypothetical protein
MRGVVRCLGGFSETGNLVTVEAGLFGSEPQFTDQTAQIILIARLHQMGDYTLNAPIAKGARKNHL